ncbi:uncharacterized protein LOC125044555 [Penaeus chinensis]|uniref:uncharacterized protein LOC125044555 n=1 Tax=Penaeus chinensis TaxID=139456 RepID=UPI001FB5D400|nr:uncharacterized protein LOC125044555 [Penaeus chinensis]
MAGDKGIFSKKHPNPGDDKTKDIITVRSNQRSRISKVDIITVHSNDVRSVTARHPVGVVVAERKAPSSEGTSLIDPKPVFVPGCPLPQVLPRETLTEKKETPQYRVLTKKKKESLASRMKEPRHYKPETRNSKPVAKNPEPKSYNPEDRNQESIQHRPVVRNLEYMHYRTEVNNSENEHYRPEVQNLETGDYNPEAYTGSDCQKLKKLSKAVTFRTDHQGGAAKIYNPKDYEENSCYLESPRHGNLVEQLSRKPVKDDTQRPNVTSFVGPPRYVVMSRGVERPDAHDVGFRLAEQFLNEDDMSLSPEDVISCGERSDTFDNSEHSENSNNEMGCPFASHQIRETLNFPVNVINSNSLTTDSDLISYEENQGSSSRENMGQFHTAASLSKVQQVRQGSLRIRQKPHMNSGVRHPVKKKNGTDFENQMQSMNTDSKKSDNQSVTSEKDSSSSSRASAVPRTTESCASSPERKR